MTDDITPIQPTEAKRIQQQEKAEAKKIAIAQEASQINMQEFAEEAFNPVAMQRRFQPLEEKRSRRVGEKEKVEEAEETRIQEIEEIAEFFEKNNEELNSTTLKLLYAEIKGNENTEELLEKVMNFYPDHSLADEALDFLAQAKTGEVANRIAQAKESFNETHGREIRAGRNMGAEAREFSKQGLGTATGLRDLYRDITGNPRPATILFDELSTTFDFEKMEKAIDFFLHSLGSDLRSKGPSIGKGELHRLMTEGRSLMAILWVYRFFKGRISLINEAFQRAGMFLPKTVTFEKLAQLFIKFLSERYPSMDKVLQLALKLGISHEQLAQIILFTQMRDAVRSVAPKLFRTPQHRHDVLMSFLEALEELEEQLDEKEAEEENSRTGEEEEEE